MLLLQNDEVVIVENKANGNGSHTATLGLEHDITAERSSIDLIAESETDMQHSQ